MMHKLFNFVSKRPKKILVGAALLSIFFAVVMIGTSVQSNIHDYIDQKYIGPLDYIDDNFNERDLLSVTIEAQNGQNILSPPLLKEQNKFFTEVESKYPVVVDDITRMLNKHIGKEKKDDGTPFTIENVNNQDLITDLFIVLYNDSPYEFERLARKALSNQEVVNDLQEIEVYRSLIGYVPLEAKYNLPLVTSMRATISTKENLTRDERREMFLGIRNLAENFSPNIKIRLYSTELVEKDIDNRVLSNSPVVIGLMILLLGTTLFITFRSLFFTIVPVIVLCLAIFWALGTSAAFGIKHISFLQIIAIPLLLGQCIDNLIHFNERFREENSKVSKMEAVKTVFLTAGKAAAITTFLNMISFSADIFTTNLVPVKDYAFLIVIGLGIALAVCYIVGAAIILVSKVPVTAKSLKAAEEGSKGARKLFDFIMRNKIGVILTALVLFGYMIFNILHIDLAFRSTSFMPKDFQTNEAYIFEKDNFSLYLPHYVLIKGNVAAQGAIDLVTKIEETLNNIPDVEHIHNKANAESINYLLAKFDKRYFPDSLNELFKQILASDIMINPIAQLTAKDIAPKIIQEKDGEFPATLIKFWPKETDSFAIKKIADSITDTANAANTDLSVQPTGVFLSFSRTMDDILWSATLAAFITLTIIALFLWWIYKRIRTSILASIPIVLGAAFGLGMLPILQIELNALNGTIAVLAMGFGIDYAIQIMSRYHEELEKHLDPMKAMRETFAHMVVPLGQCVMLTTAGLFVLVGLLPITGMFGIAAAVSLLTGYLGAVFIMPIFAVMFIKKVPDSIKGKFKGE